MGNASAKGVEWQFYSKIRPICELQRAALASGGRPEDVDTGVTHKTKGQRLDFDS